MAGHGMNSLVKITGSEAGKHQSPPYLIGTVPARWEAIGQIYELVASKDLPPCNVTSEAITPESRLEC